MRNSQIESLKAIMYLVEPNDDIVVVKERPINLRRRHGIGVLHSVCERELAWGGQAEALVPCSMMGHWQSKCKFRLCGNLAFPCKAVAGAAPGPADRIPFVGFSSNHRFATATVC